MGELHLQLALGLPGEAAPLPPIHPLPPIQQQHGGAGPGIIDQAVGGPVAI